MSTFELFRAENKNEQVGARWIRTGSHLNWRARIIRQDFFTMLANFLHRDIYLAFDLGDAAIARRSGEKT